MNSVAETSPKVSPLVSAALVLSARTMAAHHDLPRPEAAAILQATGSGRSRAYELAAKIPGAVAELIRPPGRPRAAPAESAPPPSQELSRKTIAYLMDHPGSVTGRGRRRSYSTAFRSFVLDLIEDHSELDLAAVASAVGVPLPTLRDWMRAGRPEPKASPEEEPGGADKAATARIETIVRQWERWDGDFVPFCDHVRQNLRIPYGRTLIGSILEQLGLRTPRRRPGRSPDEEARREAFETFFPGAQWQGDGSPIEVRFLGQCFRFNLELMIDTHSGAEVGFSVRDHEDAEAVIEAFDDGVETTGAAPIVVELDGRPSNHAAEVEEALGETEILPSTPGRPQSNGHAEGSHGLFQQAAPALEIEGATPKEIARQILELAVMIWARTLNHKPRADRGGRSRTSIYQEDQPTEEQIHQARERLRERCRRQERARQTQRRRGDPVVRQMLDRAFERLGLDDPKGHVRSAIARYPLDHVLAGIAIYEGKQKAGTLPPEVDARYLLAIVRNVTNKDEGLRITDELLRLRLEARDLMLGHLTSAREQLEARCASFGELLRAVIEQAMSSSRQLDRLFWLDVAAEMIVTRPEEDRARLLRGASRRIHAVFEVAYDDRLAAVRVLTRKVVPLG
jgi:transposase InsO family protein